MEDNYRHKGMRRSLVRIITEKGITDSNVISAIGKIPRHYFFDNALVEHAYQDKAFPIGEGQTISQPYTVAFQTEKLKIKAGDKVLEVGTGSGYQACVLLEVGANVYTIEFNKPLYERTKVFLPKMGYSPKFFYGDGSQGLKAHAPYDKIIVTAGAPTVPSELIKQLNIGGVLIIPVGDHKKQRMLRITKESDKKIKKESFDYFSFVPLLGEQGWKK
ncbi:protein-L-isoaspartate(D-aspartate) O-methyltransferase [Fulvivirga lutimaris]|uniref:protein-L-isoaspartate(D-aspartate) O-methyltransferase n=1 Tax=Fulvivirga lutimaris TaxID=1819566 RepID=UPI0012BB7EBD|nr:protein-L-isoaspartate(D-aspartate) O-methyltransferase [Fulvivirga lutimaris]MTI39106.1 protein-L-isoaspartate(D-aspartate) O-methyltransferase [Fulvivirga lutimaris]